MIAIRPFAWAMLLALAPMSALAAEPTGDDPWSWAIHAQSTFVEQANAAFPSPYEGANSLNPRAVGKETWDTTLYIGVRPWRGAELWANPEVDQGFGLSNTLGVAAFPSGEAYKVGRSEPYARLQRLFIRQTIDLGGEQETVDADLNQLAGHQGGDRLVLTAGKISVGDVFDANRYAHDPRRDFLNWAMIDAATFDYAADAWGYSYGGAAELYLGRWTLRMGAFNLSDVPNSTKLGTDFSQRQLIGEVEERHQLGGHPGKVRLTGWVSHANMGRFDDAVALAAQTGGPPDIAAVRRFQSRTGVSASLEQEVAADVGLFLRAGWTDGALETYEFTDVDRTLSAGVSIGGKRWGRESDTVGLGEVVNGASDARKRFLDAGGLGILIGDGKLPHPGPEAAVETYYDLAVAHQAHVSFDLQLIENPGYNTDRGPVVVGAVRLHAQF
jgi:high affinity Mn2+ porin